MKESASTAKNISIDSETITLRTADPALRDLRGLLSAMFKGLRASPGIALQLARRDLNSAYRQTFLGWFWMILPPIVTSIVWLCLNQAGIDKVTTGSIPYPVFVLSGTLLWSLFTEGVTSPSSAISRNSSLLTGFNFPVEAVLMSSAIQSGINFLVRLLVLIVTLLISRMHFSIFAPIYVLSAIPIYLCGLAIGVFLAPISGVYKDVPQTVSVVLPIFMYSVPVVFMVPEAGLLRMVMLANPLTYLFQVARGSLAEAPEVFYLMGSFISIGVALVFLALGWLVLRVCLPFILERKG